MSKTDEKKEKTEIKKKLWNFIGKLFSPNNGQCLKILNHSCQKLKKKGETEI